MDSDDSIEIDAPGSGDLGAKAMKAQVATSLFGPDANPQGSDASPIRLGRYDIIEPLGAGGMGVVYVGWDQALGRKAAIKVLCAHTADVARERARLGREAQALAKLSHPNVVQVYEVGEHEQGVFVAMELVEGVSLRQWQDATVRSTSAILGMYVQAGRGLAAAHNAGLVHRDFKPANVLVGCDSRVRVVDFGLAQGPGLNTSLTSLTSVAGQRVHARQTGSVTRTSTIAGTPAYMAPEQLAGRHADARADQFSFCVALHEALTGHRPYRLAAAHDRVARLVPAEVTTVRAVPLALRRALSRGLALEACERWPNMNALLAALEAPAVWQRRLSAWLAPIVVIGGGALVTQYQSGQDCQPQDDAPAAQWTARKRVALKASMLATQRPFAPRVWTNAEARLTRFAQRWAQTQSLSCAIEDPQRLATTTRCLERKATRFEVVLDELTHTDPDSILHVSTVLDALSDPTQCGAAGLAQESDTGLSPTLLDGLERARVQTAAGRYAEANAVLETLLADAGQLDPPAHAELLTMHGRVLRALGQYKQAGQVLAQAVVQAGPGQLRIRAQLVDLGLRLDRERWDSAQDLAAQVWLAIRTLGSPPQLRADYLDELGRLTSRDDPAAAVQLLREADQIRTELGQENSAAASTRIRLANGLADTGQTDQARALYQALLSRYERERGDNHPSYAALLFNLGMLSLEAGDLANAQDELARALAIERLVFGPESIQAASTEIKLAETWLALGELETSLSHARSAWRVLSQLPTAHSGRQAALRQLANTELDSEDHDNALRHHLQLARDYGTQGSPDILQNIGWLMCQLGRCSDARPWQLDAQQELDKLLSQPETLPLDVRLQLQVLELYVQNLAGRIELATGDTERAHEQLSAAKRAAVALYVPEHDLDMHAHVGSLVRELDATLGVIERQRDMQTMR